MTLPGQSYTNEEILDALHWCRLGRVRPARDGAFHEGAASRSGRRANKVAAVIERARR